MQLLSPTGHLKRSFEIHTVLLKSLFFLRVTLPSFSLAPTIYGYLRDMGSSNVETEKLLHKIEKYKSCLEHHERVEYAFGRLESVPITLDLLHRTGVGRTVSRWSDDEQLGDRVKALISKWRAIAEEEQRKRMPSEHSDEEPEERAKSSGESGRSSRAESERRSPMEERRSTRSPSTPSSRHLSPTSERSPTPDRSPSPIVERKKKREISRFQVSTGEGTSSSSVSKAPKRKKQPVMLVDNSDMFAAELAKANTVKGTKTKKPRLDSFHASSAKPMGSMKPKTLESHGYNPYTQNMAPINPSSKADTDIFKARKDTRRIYAGRVKTTGLTEVPRLETLCMNVLFAHLNEIEDMNGTAYCLIKPILEKCNPDQLLKIERNNEYLLEDTDELWQKICEKKYNATENDTYEDESWRDFYMRKQRESDERFKAITSKIGSHNRDSPTINVRRTMALADPRTPREVQKRAQFFGTIQSNGAVPSALEVSKSRREIFNSGSKAKFQALPTCIRASKNSSVGAKKERQVVVPPPAAGKRGALMAKTLKMLKNKRR
ncbi:hypothetical protein L596_014971 [Steinernema carpocapsae]|uniref:TFIIS N-terminal domain-containing protein n=1 Tax=Steinernema carpocapsae TaxID=34508 RepID=A0A4V6A2Z2_STECR|nr:hypothetical protein L596_014971 [Steinernema carpocapsae]